MRRIKLPRRQRVKADWKWENTKKYENEKKMLVVLRRLVDIRVYIKIASECKITSLTYLTHNPEGFSRDHKS